MTIAAFAPFELPFASETLAGSTLDIPGAACHGLLLHGAGKAHCGRYAHLRQQMAAQGISSTAFDFVGHGHSSGTVEGSSLQSRVAQAQAVLDHISVRPGFLMGNSMGAYVALHIAAHYQPAALILAVPGIYTPAAWATPFGPEFSQIIRQPDSWRDSDAFSLIATYTGKLLLVVAEQDEVIPRAIPELLFEHANRCTHKTMLTLSGSSHHWLSHLEGQPQQGHDIYQQLCRFILPG